MDSGCVTGALGCWNVDDLTKTLPFGVSGAYASGSRTCARLQMLSVAPG